MRLYGVRKLSELGGAFYVHVRCRSCQRRTFFKAGELARRLGADADLDVVKQRLKCTDCQARNPWVWSDSEPMSDEDEFDDVV